MPKCAWWSCNGCSQCLSPASAPASKCIQWCYAQPFGGWKVNLHTCAVFDGCKDCAFCGGSIARDVAAGDFGPGLDEPGDEPSDEPGDVLSESDEGNATGGAGQLSASRNHTRQRG